MQVEQKSFIQRINERADKYTEEYIQEFGTENVTEEKIVDFLASRDGNMSTNYFVNKVWNNIQSTKSIFPWAVKAIGDAINTPEYGYVLLYLQVNLEEWEKQLKQLIPEDECIWKEGKPKYELTPHITLLDGVLDEELNYPELIQIINDYITAHGIKINLKEVSLFENDGTDVVKVAIDDSNGSLANLNTILKDRIGYTTKYNDYIPHMTLAYVKSGEGKKYEGIKLDHKTWGIENINNGKIIYSDGNRNNNIVREFIEEPFLKAGIKINKIIHVNGTETRKGYNYERLVTVDPNISEEDLYAVHPNVAENEQRITDEQVQRILIRKSAEGKSVIYPDPSTQKALKKAEELRPFDYFEYLMRDVKKIPQSCGKVLVKAEINNLLKSYSSNKFSIKDFSKRQVEILIDKWQEVGDRGRGYDQVDDYSPIQKSGIDSINHNFSKVQVAGWRSQMKYLERDQLLDMSINSRRHHSVIVQLVRDELNNRE